MVGIKLVEICWLISNDEAKFLGASEIEPIHFMLGVLKVLDPMFQDTLKASSISQEDLDDINKEIVRIRNYLEVMPDSITSRRRGLRNRLNKERRNIPILEKGYLHRSNLLKKCFIKVELSNIGNSISLFEIVKLLLDEGFVSLDEIKL